MQSRLTHALAIAFFVVAPVAEGDPLVMVMWFLVAPVIAVAWPVLKDDFDGILDGTGAASLSSRRVALAKEGK